MKTIGLIGGMSWESTVTYYQEINRTVRQRLGGLHSARCLLYSVDFHRIEQLQSAGDWKKAAEVLTDLARRLEKAGADFVLICTNTMHKVADQVQKGIGVPLLHIAEATAADLLEHGIDTVGLLGTRYTMEQDFYRKVFHSREIKVLIPQREDREEVNRIIFEELCVGTFREDSRQRLLAVCRALVGEGAEGIVLGCTELPLLLRQRDTQTPLFDTAVIHSRRAALMALE